MHSKSRERFLTIDGRRVIFNPAAVIDRLASKNILHEAIPEHQKGFVAVVGDAAMAEIILLEDDFSWDDIPHTSHPERVMTRWTYAIGTRAVAQWACNAASRMAMDLMENAPSGSWKHLLESHFRKPFSASLEQSINAATITGQMKSCLKAVCNQFGCWFLSRIRTGLKFRARCGFV